MSLADRLEGWLQRGIEGIFGRRAGGVQPVEIGRRLARLLEERKQVSVSAVYAPNAFLVSLAPSDYTVLSSIAPHLSEELIRHLGRLVQQNGLSLVGPLEVSWRESDELASGVFAAEASFLPAGGDASDDCGVVKEADGTGKAENTMVFRRPAALNGSAAQAEGTALAVVRGPDAGRILRLRPGENRVGRAEDNELVLSDANVSRYHAIVTWEAGRVLVRDLGSRNGTRWNGEVVQEAVLSPSDELQMGLDVLSLRGR